MGDPLASLPEAFRLARHTVRVIRQNILAVRLRLECRRGRAGRAARAGSGFRRRAPPGRLAPGPAQRDPHPGIRAVAAAWASSARRRRSWRPAGRVGRRTYWWLCSDAAGRWFGAATACGILVYLAFGVTIIGPDQVGVVRRFGTVPAAPAPPRPALHLARADRGRHDGRARSLANGPRRACRIRLDGPSAGGLGRDPRRPPRRVGAVPHRRRGARRAERRRRIPICRSCPGAAPVRRGRRRCGPSRRRPRGSSARWPAARRPRRSSSPAAANSSRSWPEGSSSGCPSRAWASSSTASGVVDAHPPREVVPAYRDVSAAVSDAERSLNQARGEASRRHWSALAEAESTRDAARTQALRLTARARGEAGGFIAWTAAHARNPRSPSFACFARRWPPRCPAGPSGSSTPAPPAAACSGSPIPNGSARASSVPWPRPNPRLSRFRGEWIT